MTSPLRIRLSRAGRLVAVTALACAALAGTTPAHAVAPVPSAAVPSSDDPSAADPSALPHAVDRYVRTYLEKTGLPGAVVAVTKGDRVVRTAGYGRGADGAALTERTPVPVASLSKSFTALAVLQLVDDGRIGLDDPVRRHLPAFRMADERAARITVRQLLNQTSGMADSAYPELALPPARSLADSVARLRGTELADAPGTAMHYHNPNYAVAARLVEKASGQPFAEQLTERVLRPLGMQHTNTVRTTDDMPDRARGCVRAYGTVVERGHPRLFTAGAYGIVTTAGDLARWLAFQGGDGRTATGQRIVSEHGLRLTHTPPSGPGVPDEVEDRGYAMGWWKQPAEGAGPEQLLHTGELFTHNAVQTLVPDSGYGVAVYSNTGIGSGDDSAPLAQGIVQLTEGARPDVPRPFTSVADPVLAGLTLSALVLGVLGIRRAPAWARRMRTRPTWRSVLRLLPYAVPVAFFLLLGELAGLLMHRAGTLWQITYIWPALFVQAAVSAAAAVAVTAVRLGAVFRGAAGAGDRGVWGGGDLPR